MRSILVLLAVLSFAAQAQPFNTVPRSSGSTTLTSGTTATSGCTAGGVLFSSGSLVNCADTDLTFNGTTLTSTGLTVTNAPTFSALTSTRVPFAGTAGLLGDSANLTYSETLANTAPGLQIGSGSAGSSGWVIGHTPTSGESGMWSTSISQRTAAKAAITQDVNASTYIGGDGITFRIGGSTRGAFADSNPGAGLSITAGTATTDVSPLTVTRTNNNAAVATGVKFTFTDTTSAAGFLPLQILCGSGATTNCLSVSKIGALAAGSTNIFLSPTAPTVASGGCGTTVITNSAGTQYTTVTNGTGCSGSQPIVLTLPAATTGWNCYARNVSNGATSSPAQTGAVSTTSVTITNFGRTTGLAAAWTDSDVVVVSCLGG